MIWHHALRGGNLGALQALAADLVHSKVGQTGSKHVMTSRFNLGQYI